jgi:hypothetical protein
MLTVIPAIAIRSKSSSVIQNKCNNCTSTVIGFPPCDTQRTGAQARFGPRWPPDLSDFPPISNMSRNG